MASPPAARSSYQLKKIFNKQLKKQGPLAQRGQSVEANFSIDHGKTQSAKRWQEAILDATLADFGMTKYDPDIAAQVNQALATKYGSTGLPEATEEATDQKANADLLHAFPHVAVDPNTTRTFIDVTMTQNQS